MVLAGTTRPTRGKGAELTHDRQRMRGVRGSEMGGRKSLRRISMNRGCEITSVPPTIFGDLFDIWSHATPFAWSWFEGCCCQSLKSTIFREMQRLFIKNRNIVSFVVSQLSCFIIIINEEGE